MSGQGQSTPPGWHPDPFQRHEYRYWDGVQWTDQVSNQGQTASDPPVESAPAAAAAAPTGPAVAEPAYGAPPPPKKKMGGLLLLLIGGGVALLVVIALVAFTLLSGDDGGGFSGDLASSDDVVTDTVSVEAGDSIRVFVEPQDLEDVSVAIAAPPEDLATFDDFSVSDFSSDFSDFFSDADAGFDCDFSDASDDLGDLDCDEGAFLPIFIQEVEDDPDAVVIGGFAPVDGEYTVAVRSPEDGSGSFEGEIATNAGPDDFDLDDLFSDEDGSEFSDYFVSQQEFLCGDDLLADSSAEFTDFTDSFIAFCDDEFFSDAFSDQS
jgi:hypothetical protein